MSLKRLTVLWLGACALLGLALLLVRGAGREAGPVDREIGELLRNEVARRHGDGQDDQDAGEQR